MTRLAIISPNRYKYSETFIHAHCRELPFDKWILYGGYFPKRATQRIEEEGRGLEEWRKKKWWQGKKEGEEEREKALEAFLKKENIDVILAEYGPSGVAVASICQRLQIPLVVHFHGYDAYRSDILGHYGPQYPALFEAAAVLVAVSNDMHRQLISLGAPSEKVHHLPYGIDTEAFTPVDPAENPPHIVAVGRFTPKKAPLQLLEAFRLTHEHVPEAQLTVLGDGELLPAAQDWLELFPELHSAVHLPGAATPDQVRATLAQARLFALASRVPESGDSEGLPLAVLEAMATGLPVLATRHAGIPDAVTDGTEGLLVEPGQVKALSEGMVRLLQDTALATQMGAQARQRVTRDYDRRDYHAKLSDLLEGAVRR